MAAGAEAPSDLRFLLRKPKTMGASIPRSEEPEFLLIPPAEAIRSPSPPALSPKIEPSNPFPDEIRSVVAEPPPKIFPRLSRMPPSCFPSCIVLNRVSAPPGSLPFFRNLRRRDGVWHCQRLTSPCTCPPPEILLFFPPEHHSIDL